MLQLYALRQIRICNDNLSLFFHYYYFFFYRCFSWRKENQGIRHTAGVCFAKEVYKSTALCTMPCPRKTSMHNTLMTQLPKSLYTSLLHGLCKTWKTKETDRVSGKARQNNKVESNTTALQKLRTRNSYWALGVPHVSCLLLLEAFRQPWQISSSHCFSQDFIARKN